MSCLKDVSHHPEASVWTLFTLLFVFRWQRNVWSVKITRHNEKLKCCICAEGFCLEEHLRLLLDKVSRESSPSSTENSFTSPVTPVSRWPFSLLNLSSCDVLPTCRCCGEDLIFTSKIWGIKLVKGGQERSPLLCVCLCMLGKPVPLKLYVSVIPHFCHVFVFCLKVSKCDTVSWLKDKIRIPTICPTWVTVSDAAQCCCLNILSLSSLMSLALMQLRKRDYQDSWGIFLVFFVFHQAELVICYT